MCRGANVLGAKLLRLEGCVQLIVFFAAIREILKREIYGADKQWSCFNENKGPISRIGMRLRRILNPSNSVCEYRFMRSRVYEWWARRSKDDLAKS